VVKLIVVSGFIDVGIIIANLIYIPKIVGPNPLRATREGYNAILSEAG
jgi:hypothetical protein